MGARSCRNCQHSGRGQGGREGLGRSTPPIPAFLELMEDSPGGQWCQTQAAPGVRGQGDRGSLRAGPLHPNLRPGAPSLIPELGQERLGLEVTSQVADLPCPSLQDEHRGPSSPPGLLRLTTSRAEVGDQPQGWLPCSALPGCVTGQANSLLRALMSSHVKWSHIIPATQSWGMDTLSASKVWHTVGACTCFNSSALRPPCKFGPPGTTPIKWIKHIQATVSGQGHLDAVIGALAGLIAV